MGANKIIGKKFNRLKCVAITNKKTADNHAIGIWICECDNVKEISVTRVINGYTRSCGCLFNEIKNKIGFKHGGKGTSEYRIWSGMKDRCNNYASKDYSRYGARGISVCERWSESFSNFLSDMGNRPSKKHSLDRINNDGNYGPDNCRWATGIQQVRNRRNSVYVELDGKRIHLSEIAYRLGISYGAAYRRLMRGRLHG